MEHSCNSSKKVKNIEKQLNHHFTNLASLPKSLLNWIEQTTNNIIIVTNDIGDIVYVTKSITNILGYEQTSLLGKNWTTVISVNEVSKVRAFVNSLNESDLSLLLNVPALNGKNIPFECTITKEQHNGEVFYVSMLKDITNKQEAEEMMVRSEKMSVAGQLAAGIAHEIRNPLTSLKGFLQLLQAGVNQKDAYYKIMIDEIDKIETITSELLFISKPLTDNKQMESLSHMIEDVIVLLKPQARLRDIILKWIVENEIHIYCDRSQMKQVLINLVKNAIEASEGPGVVTIEVRSSEDQVYIDVIDEGVGISEDIIHKLDEPFFTTKETGTGLGLMITKNLLSHHGANLAITQNATKGSTFRIQFPKKISQ